MIRSRRSGNRKEIFMANTLQENTLRYLEEALVGIEIAAQFHTEEFENGEVSLVTALLENFGTVEGDVYGEFFFLPDANEDERKDGYSIFCSTLTICNEIQDEQMADLIQAIGLISGYVSLGGFSVNIPNRTLIFKHVVSIPPTASEEAFRDTAEAAVTLSLDFSEGYAGVLAGIAKGTQPLEDIFDFMPDVDWDQD